ncbi:MAG TPA: VOC family protein [Pseudonocardia sp.]|nr:VOC family protein [Pseudonocardia sp.]
MTIRESIWPTGTPCWVDIAVPDVAEAMMFYRSVLGWSYVDTGPELNHYTVCRTFRRDAAAIGPAPSTTQPSAWTVYLASDDADTTAKLIVENGGTLVVEPADVGHNGRMCVALDPCGGMFGVWQAIETIGVEIIDEPGALVWTDARLTEPAVGMDFYAAVFGYDYQPVPGAPDGYSTFAVGGRTAGGMGGMLGSTGAPSHWLAYFAVDDVDATVADAAVVGGLVRQPPQDTPFGRTALLSDRFGATFGLHGPAISPPSSPWVLG